MDNSDSDDIVLTIDLHYVLDKEGLHDMDAEVLSDFIYIYKKR